jgi:hypothetical protein
MTGRGSDRHAIQRHAALAEEGVEEIVLEPAEVFRVVVLAVGRNYHLTPDVQFEV